MDLTLGRRSLCLDLSLLHCLACRESVSVIPTDSERGGQSRAPTAYLFICFSRLGSSLGELQVVWPDKSCPAKHLEDKILN